ncbi:hypothetical protein [Burkholderia glumae]
MQQTVTPRTLLDLGFEHGIEATEDPTEFAMSSRVAEYRLGYVLGRSCVECMHRASRSAAAVTAGNLGARFGVKLDALINAMGSPDLDRRLIEEAYVDVRAKGMEASHQRLD